MLSIKEIVRENYEVTMSDKKEIDEIISIVDNLLIEWKGMDLKDRYEYNPISNKGNGVIASCKDKEGNELKHRQFKSTYIINSLYITILEKRVCIQLTNEIYNGGHIEMYSTENSDYLVVVSTKFKDNNVTYKKSILYHELQHFIDFKTKYVSNMDYVLNKNIDTDKVMGKSHNQRMRDYMSHPTEFNAWFTSIVMPFLDKNKGIGFKETMRKLYEEDDAFKDYFLYVNKLTRQRFLKRAYKYYIEHNK